MQAEKYYGLNRWARSLVDVFVVEKRFSIAVPKNVFKNLSVKDFSQDSQNPRSSFDFNFESHKPVSYKVKSRNVKVRLVRRRIIDEIKSIFIMDKKPSYKLYEFTLPSGRKLTEYVQFAEFTKGPIYFTALRDSAGQIVQESLWSDDEIDKLVAQAFR